MHSSGILVTRTQWAQLLKNGWRTAPDAVPELQPIVRLFQPEGIASWLLVLLDPRDNDRAYGLYDAGDGRPEFGFVSLRALSARGCRHLGQRVERDCRFVPDRSLAAYAAASRSTGSSQT